MNNREETLSRLIRGMGDPDPKIADDFERAWLEHWDIALNTARNGNRRLVHALLDTQRPVPAHIAKELLYLKARRGAPRAITQTPEEVVELVYHAIADGYPFSQAISADDNPAFKEAASRVQGSASTIERRWNECPEVKRRNIQRHVEVLRGLLKKLQDD